MTDSTPRAKQSEGRSSSHKKQRSITQINHIRSVEADEALLIERIEMERQLEEEAEQRRQAEALSALFQQELENPVDEYYDNQKGRWVWDESLKSK